MRISFERFRQSVGGALDVLEEDGWIRFHRFSAAASDALRGVNDFERKSYGTAGICLRFRTRCRAALLPLPPAESRTVSRRVV